MKNKKIYYVIFLVLMLSVGFVVGNSNGEYRDSQKSKILAVNTEVNSNAEKINQSVNKIEEAGFVVYYFHNSKRCRTCYKIENYTKEVFENNFKDSYTFKIINIDKPENRHFINEYSIYTKSVVLVQFDEDGKRVKFDNLPRVWNTIRNEENFKNYIKTEMSNFLK